jgi:very-short-patch-repair endonuclease/DNA replication protein DnaC
LNDRQAYRPDVEKAIRLVKYLTGIARLRTKLIRDLSDYQNVVWLSSVPHERGCFTRAWGEDEEHEPDEWLEVQNRREPGLPSVPPPCEDWVNQSALRTKSELPELLAEITREVQNPDWREGSDQPETVRHTHRLVDHPEIQREWDRYVEEKWLPWTEEHNEWEKVHKIYSQLFAIHQEQLRLGEEYELVLALGLLTWQTLSGHRVRRHLIVADAILEFEARLGKFIVRPHTEGAKLRPELDMLDIEEQPARAEETAKSSLTQAEDNPWEKGCIEGVLQALVHSINAQGDYDDSLETKSLRASEKPVVEYAPALILRKRSVRGLTETLKRIKERIEKGEDITAEFADLAEIRTDDDRAMGDTPEGPIRLLPEEIFFPKPSNEEQRRIVNKIQSASGVLVQGPPGTGKSHTIANLICHLLATGERTLITAKTPRALQVLEGLVPSELRPLCINLLGSGVDERRSLESSVGGILRKNEEWKEDRAEKQRKELEERLRNLREERAKVSRRLRDIRESETHSQSIAEGTYRGTAARIAEAVNRDKPTYEWFTDRVPLDKSCPICGENQNLATMLPNLRYFTPEKRRELDLELPESVPTPQHFTDLVRNEVTAIEEEQSSAVGADKHYADVLSGSDSPSVESISRSLSNFQATRKQLMMSPHPWMREALRDILGRTSKFWHELSRVTANTIASVEPSVALADDTDIAFQRTTDIKALREDARKLKEHIEKGGKLGWGPFRPKPVKELLHVIKTVRIDGHPCSRAQDLSLLCDVLHVQIECEKIWRFWNRLTSQTQGPYALQVATLKSLYEALGTASSLDILIHECREALRKCSGVGEPVWADESQVETLIASCRLAHARRRKRIAAEEFRSLEDRVSFIARIRGQHPIANEFLHAIRDRDVDRFAHAANTLQNLDQVLPQLTDRLKQTSNEPFWSERLQHIGDAWRWAQARHWIEEYIRQEDVPALSKRSKQIDDEINTIIGKLASLYAWSFCFSRLKEDHRRHMEAWQQSMRRLGKGTGKYAPRRRREAQQHLNQCREAVPAWVMPLHRVWDTVDPAPGMFDVIIVDEASQCGVEALPLFYLGKRILIVGDDKQISPDAVGLPRDAVHRLMEEFLHDFHFKDSFDVESSLFGHGKLRFGTRRIILCEHFRCMPEIIRFSNDLCYSDTPLIPLRQYGPNRLTPLQHVFVRTGYREGSNSRTINRPEAEAIVDKIVELCGDNQYDGKSIGVVVLQGEAQAGLIESELLERLGAEEMERRRLVCGNPYSFQGDERDIILLSLVAATNAQIGTLTGSASERRFNVAASRARDMMILFHSVTREDLSASCFRRRLLEFFESTKPQQIAGIDRDELERRASQDNRRVVDPPAPFESWFEVDVALELLRKDFNVSSQHDVAGKRIDLVVEGGHARLAVECDGDHWHGADRYEHDMQRQRQLERCGWEFVHVRESAFYANKVGTLGQLWRALEERDIFPRSSLAVVSAEVGEEEREEFRRDAAQGNDSVEEAQDPLLQQFRPSGTGATRT